MGGVGGAQVLVRCRERDCHMQRDETGDFLGMTLHRLLVAQHLQRCLLFHRSQSFLVLFFPKYVVYAAVLLLLKL